MNAQNNTQEQNIFIYSRKKAEITGVLNVISFDDTGVILQTELGILSIDGIELAVTKLDTVNKIVIIEGNIYSLYYSNESEKPTGGFLGKLFR